MSFFFRKSFRSGPIHFNLSKSGLGVSAGIKGLRIGLGPRRPCVSAGRHGVYYRKQLRHGEVHDGDPGALIVRWLEIVLVIVLVLWLMKRVG